MIDALIIIAGVVFTGLFCYGVWLLIYEDWK